MHAQNGVDSFPVSYIFLSFKQKKEANRYLALGLSKGFLIYHFFFISAHPSYSHWEALMASAYQTALKRGITVCGISNPRSQTSNAVPCIQMNLLSAGGRFVQPYPVSMPTSSQLSVFFFISYFFLNYYNRCNL